MKLFLIGSKLSPFSLKVEALLQFCSQPYTALPSRQYRWHSLRSQVLVRITRAGLVKPDNSNFDERDDLPLVPYLYQPGKP